MKPAQEAVMLDADRQRQAVRRRSQGRCEFEVIFDSGPGVPSIVQHNGHQVKGIRDPLGRLWVRCNRPAGQTAHVYRRWKTTSDTKFDPRVALDGCDHCHKNFDAYQITVRVDADFLRTAWDVIVYDAESRGFQARNETLASLGPRP